MPGALICSLFERKEILYGMILNNLLYKDILKAILSVFKFGLQKSFICQDFVRKAELFEICYNWEQAYHATGLLLHEHKKETTLLFL